MDFSGAEASLVDPSMPSSMTEQASDNAPVMADKTGRQVAGLSLHACAIDVSLLGSSEPLSLVVQAYSNMLLIVLSNTLRISNLFLVSHQKGPLDDDKLASAANTANLSAVTLVGHSRVSEALEVYAKLIYKHVILAKDPKEERALLVSLSLSPLLQIRIEDNPKLLIEWLASRYCVE